MDNIQDVREELNHFKNLRLTDDERAWAVELEDLFSKTGPLVTEVISLEDELEANLAEFVDLREQLDAVLDDEIQVLTHQELAEATRIAHDMETRTYTFALVLLLFSLAFGAYIAVDITRSITGPVGKLVSANRAIAGGDLSQRVDIQSKDEFGILGASFNEMVTQRQQAHDELDLRVQERTAELVQVNEMMDLADEVGRIITTTLNIDEVYEQFALEVKKLVDFDRFNIKLVDLEANNYTLELRPKSTMTQAGPI